MNDDIKKSGAKKTTPQPPEDKTYIKAEGSKTEKWEELMEKMLESQRLSEERFMTIALKAFQNQSAQNVNEETILKRLELESRRPFRETNVIIEPSVIIDKRHINRNTDRLFAYCESSYIYFKEEPIEIDEGPGHHKPPGLY